MTMRRKLPKIDLRKLSNVTGGAPTVSGKAAAGEQAVMTALTGILESVKELQTQKKPAMGMEMMMMMMMMKRRG